MQKRHRLGPLRDEQRIRRLSSLDFYGLTEIAKKITIVERERERESLRKAYAGTVILIEL